MVNLKGQDSRKPNQPYVARIPQQWASDLVVAQHEEALWTYGENCLFTLMWRATDFAKGLVERCSICYVGDRGAKAFRQPPSKKGCDGCYGTTFEGGFREQVVRPAIFSDRNVEEDDSERGTFATDSLQVETTGDFAFRNGDYIFRLDGSRYQAEEKGEGILRTGFATPNSIDSFRGGIPVARLEDDTAVAFVIPLPEDQTLETLLSGAPKTLDFPHEVP